MIATHRAATRTPQVRLAGRLRGFTPLGSVRARIIGAFAFICGVFIVAAGMSVWQEESRQANLDSLDRHSSTATLLQEAEAQAGISALLLQRYVVTGDPAYVEEVRAHGEAAVNSLSAAVSQSDRPELIEITVKGAFLVQSVGGITALRLAGDVGGANAAMEEIVPVFRDFRLALEEVTAQERREVLSLRVSDERASDLALSLLLVSATTVIVVAMTTTFFVVRSILAPLTALEATASAASQGDLSARAPATGPRELAHLGSVLNQMMSAVEARTQELKDTLKKLRDRNRQLGDARAQAATDPLTGLGNHRAFHKRLREEIARAESSGARVGLLLFDIDGFKGVNDSLGHLAGDELMRHLAGTAADVVERENAYRYGGDEFAVILPGLNKKKATQTAEQLRERVERMTVPDAGSVTISVGVGSFPEMAVAAEELIYRTDMAMYWAKSTGKNRVGDWDGLLSRRADTDGPQYAGDRAAPDVVASLVNALATKDPNTRNHIERCAWYSAELAQELGLSDEDVEVLRLASLLHDIGKLAIPDVVLRKPGPLDSSEWDQMRLHPTLGSHMLSQIDSVAEAVPAILHHHERFDGSGYPAGLAGEAIPLASRILMVTDAFDAMTADRPYRKAMSIEAAIEELQANAGTQFDAGIVEAFAGMIRRKGAHPLQAEAATGAAISADSSARAPIPG